MPDSIPPLPTAALPLTLSRRIVVPPPLRGHGERYLHVELDVTSKCNLRCRMCYFSLDRYFFAPAVLMTPAAFAGLAAALLPHAHTLTLSLGNEPLTSPHFPAILETAAGHGVPAITFYTHGQLLMGRMVDGVLRHGVTQVTVSVDGATARTYEYIRRGAKFDRLLRNLRHLVAERDRRGQRVPMLRLAVVMMRMNVHELEAIVDLAHDLGAAEMTFVHMTPYGGLGMEEESLVRHQELSNYWLRRALDRAAALGIIVSASPQMFGDERATGTVPAAEPALAAGATAAYCHFPFEHVSINAGGHVLPCPFAHGEPAYGTVSETTSFEEIWLGPAFTELRRRILDSDPPPMCRRCSFLANRAPGDGQLFAVREAN